MMYLRNHFKYGLLVIALLFLGASFLIFARSSQAANFSISPSSGNFKVGETFDVSVLVDTKGQEINAVQMNLAFPADKLQLVSPSAGSSIISIYTTPPKYDNRAGTVQIIGGIPNGINVSSGLVAKLTFRVKGIGTAAIRFAGESQVLLNDGKGTNVLDNTFGGSYKLELPAGQGPGVFSDTHPDQEVWYKESNVALVWDVGMPPAQSYSYSISDNPTDIPDDVPESADTKAYYKNVPNGLNYFHIKALRDGRWGGVTHYSLKIDNTAPANFDIELTPGARTFVRKSIVNFLTTDALSGIDRYEIKILPLKIEGRNKAITDNQLFVDATSPYQTTELLEGTYEVIVRAYDKAGNLREVNQKLEITDSWLWFLSQDGVTLPFGKQVKWSYIIFSFIFLLIILFVLAYILRKWYKLAHAKVEENHLPQSIATQLAELNQYRQKYGKISSLVLLLFISTFFFASNAVLAQTPANNIDVNLPTQELQTPPVITSHSANIKDDELFYVAGRSLLPESVIQVHLQSLVDGSSFDFTTTSDKRGDWTYRHNDFLPGGKYIIWAHNKFGAQLSSPSPQVEMDVKPVAINWGNSRITYQSIYISIIFILSIILLSLLLYIIIHWFLVRHRKKIFAQKLLQLEDSLKRGFIAMRRDIEGELMLIKRASLSAELSGEQKVREQQLREDLKNIEELVGREMWEVETFEQLPN